MTLPPSVSPVLAATSATLVSSSPKPASGSYSARSQAIEPFHVMALLARANELQASGHDVIHLEIGEPDFVTAAPIIQAGQAALAAGHTRYTARALHWNAEDKGQHEAMGFHDGWGVATDQLLALAQTL